MKTFLFCLLPAVLLTIQHGSTGLNAQEPKTELGKELNDRVVDVVYEGAFSKNALIREKSFSILANYLELLGSLDEGNQRELVKSAIQDENSVIARLGMKILVNSKIENSERHQLLLTLLDSKTGNLAEDAIAVLQSNREQVLQQIIATIENDLTGVHKNELLLIERLGPDAAATVPVIIKSFHAKKELAQKSHATQSDLKSNAGESSMPGFDYLSHVYAIAEIGPAAHDALPIALAAAEEMAVEGRTEYSVAGFICIERLLTGKSGTRDERLLAGLPPDRIQKYEKYADSLVQQYDSSKDGVLDQAEMKAMRRPPVGADANKDGQITRNELVHSLSGGTAARATPKNSIRQTVRNGMQKK